MKDGMKTLKDSALKGNCKFASHLWLWISISLLTICQVFSFIYFLQSQQNVLKSCAEVVNCPCKENKIISAISVNSSTLSSAKHTLAQTEQHLLSLQARTKRSSSKIQYKHTNKVNYLINFCTNFIRNQNY